MNIVLRCDIKNLRVLLIAYQLMFCDGWGFNRLNISLNYWGFFSPTILDAVLFIHHNRVILKIIYYI